MLRATFLFLLLIVLSVWAEEQTYQELETSFLFRDLEIVEAIDREMQDSLPFIYNSVLIGGYWNMPSARMDETGMLAVGAASVPPYYHFSLNYQVLYNLEFSGTYRVFRGMLEPGFGHMGFGDDADRGANIKLSLLSRNDGFKYLPEFAVGLEDFYGSKRFHSFYVVATKEWLRHNLETTFGWSKGRMKGLFGGAAWSPWRKRGWPLLSNLTFLGEYDNIDYKKHPPEHPQGRKVSSRINVGLMARFWDMLEFKVGTQRGRSIAASGSVNYNLGQTKGFFPKVDDPPLYQSPLDHEPLGLLRPDREFAQELAFAFSEQGMTLYEVYLSYKEGKKELWLKMVNIRYREEEVIRERIEFVLSSLIPENIDQVRVVVEANGVPINQYTFRGEDLLRFREGSLGPYELETLSPLQNVSSPPGEFERTKIFRRRKEIWTFTVRPRLLSFFGSTSGKFKYALGVVAGPEGYIARDVYYKLQLAYNISSSISDLKDMDRYNPSQILNVRTDSVNYYKSNSVSVEQAYIQKGFNFGGGWFWRLAGGYFEVAYGGAATELLYYPVNQNWAVGLEAAMVFKRKYEGLGFTTQVRKLDGFTPKYEHFIGYQYFLDLYYNFKPASLDFKISAGQFLARDKGARFEVGRYYPSGLRFSVWYTRTNAKDIVNGERYYDKGIAFDVPLDIFLKKSSRTRIGYAMAAWLRDVGAKAATGKLLYPTVHWERL